MTKTAERDLKVMNPSLRLKILQAVRTLSFSPFPRGNIIKKLTGTKIALYRLRMADYRIVYHIDGHQCVILFITARKDLEKRLKGFGSG